MILIFSDRWFIGCALAIIGAYGVAAWAASLLDRNAE